MVRADPDPVERVRWTSTRRHVAGGVEDDDDDRESMLRGGVRLVPAEDYAPLALDDPWWVKLLGFKSPRKAVMFAAFVIGMGLYFIIAGTVAQSLDMMDTSTNSLENWLDMLRVSHFRKPQGAGVQYVDKQLALKGRSAGRGVFSDEVRLPVGIALQFHQAVAQMEAKECASGDIFHYVCYTTSRRHQKKFKDMKKSLNSLILDVSRDPGGSSLPGSRKQMLLSLLAQALKYGVTTEIARNDLDVNTASILQDTLIGIREKEKQHSEYNDIMLFPGTSRLLYRGSFLGLR
ncbi:hypothetical protein GUITHDRAFT_119175 [Guillardia theta CCMP2712]|uniref:Uncharacterized protein n=1 Tax=Guillardia theta (strain CCMP2712) TaxID=905079 RepID=L1IFD7_GUITC|nr:hypothetical protein GUITHDRAFT_119175 [Guillardia theta CCMP2712]EKX34629.1 hypothetical protein GUITHDRAFT_119175 [Guillardia theta CCMP2712]|eukprot:XP_005821609.1 hypothetical protein GUITHDRAFT_119175 [Guillardia theta CCMP2712]